MGYCSKSVAQCECLLSPWQSAWLNCFMQDLIGCIKIRSPSTIPNGHHHEFRKYRIKLSPFWCHIIFQKRTQFYWMDIYTVAVKTCYIISFGLNKMTHSSGLPVSGVTMFSVLDKLERFIYCLTKGHTTLVCGGSRHSSYSVSEMTDLRGFMFFVTGISKQQKSQEWQQAEQEQDLFILTGGL